MGKKLWGLKSKMLFLPPSKFFRWTINQINKKINMRKSNFNILAQGIHILLKVPKMVW